MVRRHQRNGQYNEQHYCAKKDLGSVDIFTAGRRGGYVYVVCVCSINEESKTNILDQGTYCKEDLGVGGGEERRLPGQ